MHEQPRRSRGHSHHPPTFQLGVAGYYNSGVSREAASRQLDICQHPKGLRFGAKARLRGMLYPGQTFGQRRKDVAWRRVLSGDRQIEALRCRAVLCQAIRVHFCYSRIYADLKMTQACALTPPLENGRGCSDLLREIRCLHRSPSKSIASPEACQVRIRGGLFCLIDPLLYI